MSNRSLARPQTPSLRENLPLLDITAITEPQDDTFLSKVDESPIILRLKQALRDVDRTVVQVLDNFDPDSLLEVGAVLEHSHFKYDYFAGESSLIITMISPHHEFGARVFREIFEPAMAKVAKQYGVPWVYHTNTSLPLKGSQLTPDGAILTRNMDPRLIVEVSASERLAHTRKKIRTFFKNPAILAAIILNIDEDPVFANPTSCSKWDWDEKGVTKVEFPRSDGWGPCYFRGHCWGGTYSCQIEICWPPGRNHGLRMNASLIPPSPAIDTEEINIELADIWAQVVKLHFGDKVSVETDIVRLDTNLFRRGLEISIGETAYCRYRLAWEKAHCARFECGDEGEMDEYLARVAARVEARGKRLASEVEGSEDGMRPSKSARKNSSKN